MANNAGPFSFQSLPASNLSVRSITTTASMTASDQIIYASTAGGDYTLTLVNPATLPTGTVLYVVKTTSDLNVLTISSISTTLNTNGESVMLVVNASGAWTVVERRIPSTWTTFTPTGSWSTNTTYTGFWRRIGDSVQVRIYLALAGAPTTATLSVNMPTGLTIDTAKLTSTDASDGYIGICYMFDSGTARYPGIVSYSTSSAVTPKSLSNDLPVRALTINATSPVTWAASDAISIVFEAPVSGWNG